MDIVKATINIKDGLIQLEGPQEFVEKYLDQFKQLIISLPTAPKTSKTADTAEKEKDKTLKRKSRTRMGPTCAEKIRELISEGYFKEPKTTAEISEYLTKQKGYVNTTKDVAANLKGMFDRGQIKRIQEGNAFKYYVNV